MAVRRKTIYFGTGQGLNTEEFMGNSGCIHPVQTVNRQIKLSRWQKLWRWIWH